MENSALSLIFLLSAICTVLCLGTFEERIKGPATMNASPGEFPYLAKIRNKETNKLIGSGLLLRSKVVLLIGYNYIDLQPSDIKVVLGEYDRTDGSTRQEIDVNTIKIHPEFYRTDRYSGDLALLQLAKIPKFCNEVKTFGMKNIVNGDEDLDILGDSSSCIVPGYGLTEWTESETKLPRKLKKFIPQMQKQRLCAKFVGEYGEYYPRKKILCAINDDLTSLCKFDGGTPLLCVKDGKMKLYGLTFAGTRYCADGLSLFTRISVYYPWIKRNANILQN